MIARAAGSLTWTPQQAQANASNGPSSTSGRVTKTAYRKPSANRTAYRLIVGE
jgi:hypothetical protein